jgi:hypothetical protein
MDITKLVACIPLTQQLCKYAFWLLCLAIFAPQVSSVLRAAEERLAAGAEVSIGPAGIKLGEAPKMPTASADIGRMVGLGTAPVKSGSGGSGLSILQGAPEKGMMNLSSVAIEDMFYLVHGAAKQGTDYSVKVTLGALDPDLMGRVEKVVYHLHESFDINVREVTDRSSNFALEFTAWGQFEVKADAYLVDQPDPVKLRRWLNF